MYRACVHSKWAVILAMLEAATDEEHGLAIMRVVGLGGAVWWLAMVPRLDVGGEKSMFDRF